jgi:threonylcarbamoyladenosine tRNA methylthiotransferase MtaB
VVVTGCYAQVAPDKLSALPEVELVVGNEEKKGLAALLKGAPGPDRVLVSEIDEKRKVEPLQLESFAEHTRAFLQVQNGCDSFCAYCIVPFARGRSRSVEPNEVLAGISRLTDQGFREVVLTGIHLGHYGRDLGSSVNLLNLLEEVESRLLLRRLRLGSLEPLDISRELISFLGSSSIVCPHLHIPLQSGSDSTLTRMNRGYSGGYFRDLVERIVTALPDACVGLDVIAGFPGETDAEFSATMRLIEELPVGYLHVFPFSSRPGTKAAAMPGHLQSRVIKERAEALRTLGESKREAYHRRFVGRELDLLVMQQGKDGLCSGLSRNYLLVQFPGDESLANSEVRVRLTSADRGRLLGEKVNTPS